MKIPPQTKLESLCESILGVLIGFVVSIFIQKLVFPAYGIHLNTTDNLSLAAVFTVASIIRGYIVRRAFNWAAGRKFYS